VRILGNQKAVGNKKDGPFPYQLQCRKVHLACGVVPVRQGEIKVKVRIRNRKKKGKAQLGATLKKKKKKKNP